MGQRAFGQINYHWEPSNLYHLPIYFEDFCLERYGHTRHYLIQPFVSGGLFATMSRVASRALSTSQIVTDSVSNVSDTMRATARQNSLFSVSDAVRSVNTAQIRR